MTTTAKGGLGTCHTCGDAATWATIGERACSACFGPDRSCGICGETLRKLSSALAFGRPGERFGCPNCRATWSHLSSRGGR